jgi:ubiquinone biosynthesis protein
MNWLQLLWLFREIYTKKKPRVKKIEQLGLLAVKVGQMHAIRADILPASACKELAKLYSSNTAVSPKNVQSLLKQAPKKFHRSIKHFNKEPLATASVGQVHTAQYNGKKVVVKFIKKDQGKQFARDVKRAELFLKIVLLFYPKLKRVANPLEALSRIRYDTLRELDLYNEMEGAKILKNLQKKHKNMPLKKLAFAKVYPEVSNDKVMVSDYIDGDTFEELIDQETMDYTLLLELFKIQGSYIFGIGTLHGDIHPGNIMYANNKIYFVDMANIAQVSELLVAERFDR